MELVSQLDDFDNQLGSVIEDVSVKNGGINIVNGGLSGRHNRGVSAEGIIGKISKVEDKQPDDNFVSTRNGTGPLNGIKESQSLPATNGIIHIVDDKNNGSFENDNSGQIMVKSLEDKTKYMNIENKQRGNDSMEMSGISIHDSSIERGIKFEQGLGIRGIEFKSITTGGSKNLKS